MGLLEPERKLTDHLRKIQWQLVLSSWRGSKFCWMRSWTTWSNFLVSYNIKIGPAVGQRTFRGLFQLKLFYNSMIKWLSLSKLIHSVLLCDFVKLSLSIFGGIIYERSSDNNILSLKYAIEIRLLLAIEICQLFSSFRYLLLILPYEKREVKLQGSSLLKVRCKYVM